MSLDLFILKYKKRSLEFWQLFCWYNVGTVASLSRAILDGEVFKRCEVYAQDVSLYNLVNHLFTGKNDVVL